VASPFDAPDFRDAGLIVSGDVEIDAFSSEARIPGFNVSALSSGFPAGTFFGNLFEGIAPARSWDWDAFAGDGIAYSNSLNNEGVPFPTVTDEYTVTFDTADTTQTIPLPAGRLAGDRVLIFINVEGSAPQSIDTPTDWTMVGTVAGSVTSAQAVIEKVIDETEDDDLVITYDVSAGGLARVYLIQDSDLTETSSIAAVRSNSGATGSSSPRVFVTAGLSNCLFFALLAIQSDLLPNNVIDFPDDFIATGEDQNNEASANDCTIAYGYRTSRASQLTPTSWSWTTSQHSTAITLAVPGRRSGVLSLDADQNVLANSFDGNLFDFDQPNRPNGWAAFAGPGLVYTSSANNSGAPFPTVSLTDGYQFNLPSTSHSISLPKLTAGQGVLMFLSPGITAVATLPSERPWVQIATGAVASARCYVYWLTVTDAIAAQSDLTVIVLSATQSLNARIWVIDDASVTVNPSISTASTATTAGSTTNDPNPVTPALGTANYLFFALLATAVEENIVNTFPTGYGDTGQDFTNNVGTGADNSIAYCTKSARAATEDPSQFIYDAFTNGSSVGFTVAIPPRPTGQLSTDDIPINALEDIASPSLLGRVTAGAGEVEVLTPTQATTVLNVFTPTLKGLAPLSGGGTTNFLRADGTWAPASGGATPAWSVTLAVSVLSGANNPVIEDAQYMQWGVAAPTEVTGQIRSNEIFHINVDRSFNVNAGENVNIIGPDSHLYQCTNGNIDIEALDDVTLTATNGFIGITADDNVDVIAGLSITLTPSGSLLMGSPTLTNDIAINSAGIIDINSVGDIINLNAGGGINLNAGGQIVLESDTDVVLMSGGAVNRLTITDDGEWEVEGDGGAAGEVLTSQGPGVPPAWVASAGDDWADVLAADPSSGANNPVIESGQHIRFGAVDGTLTGQIRSSVDPFRTSTSGSLQFFVGTSGFFSFGSEIEIQATGYAALRSGVASVTLSTNSVDRLTINNDGEWEVEGDGGAIGEVLTSQGPGVGPAWVASAAADWADVLAADPSSGANNPHIETGQILSFGNSGALPAAGELRSSAPFEINVIGAMTIDSTSVFQGIGGTFAVLTAETEDAVVRALAGSAILSTDSVDRLAITVDGEWEVEGDAGERSETIVSGGPGAPPAWGLIRPDILDNFMGGTAVSGSIGALGWHFANVTGSGTCARENNNNLDGVIVITTGGNTNDACYLSLGDTSARSVMAISQFQWVEWHIRPQIGTNINFMVGLGFSMQTALTFSTQGIFFHYESATSDKWRCTTRSSSVSTTTTTTLTMGTAGVSRLAIRHNLDTFDVDFFVNGNLVASHTTNIPSAPLNLGMRVEQMGASSRYLRLSRFTAIRRRDARLVDIFSEELPTDPVAFVSVETGDDSFTATVPAGDNRLLVAVVFSSAATADRTATYGGVAMTAAITTNDWVQIFYMLDPPVGAATLAVTGGSVAFMNATHYTGVDSFQAASAQEGQAASASFSPSDAAVVVFGMSAESAGHAPLAGTNERYDAASNEWQGDRIVTGSGSVNVGASTATNPDYAGCIFLSV
jgi:hypothetical protein